MNQLQLKRLITAGVFSTAMLSGLAFAGDAPTSDGSAPPMPKKSHHKHLKGHSCKGMNTCKGQGGCKTGAQGCKGKNSCKGQGGCATGDYKGKAPKAMPKAAASEAPSDAAGKADNHGCSGKNGCAGK